MHTKPHYRVPPVLYLKPTVWIKVPCTSAKPHISVRAEGIIHITQDVVRAIRILPRRQVHSQHQYKLYQHMYKD